MTFGELPENSIVQSICNNCLFKISHDVSPVLKIKRTWLKPCNEDGSLNIWKSGLSYEVLNQRCDFLRIVTVEQY